MTMIKVTPQALDDATRALEGKGPVLMVNLVRYRAQADYDEGEAAAPCSGRDAYLQRYAAAFNAVAARVAPGEPVSVFLLGAVHATLVAPHGEAWDDIAIVQYPRFEVLRRILASPDYERDAAPHQRAALADWCFFATTKIDLAA